MRSASANLKSARIRAGGRVNGYGPFFLVIFVSLVLPASGIDCPGCGLGKLPDLAMTCPACRSMLHTRESSRIIRSSAILEIEVFYNGENPDRLPEYGKIYINRKYSGNIPLIDRKKRENLALEANQDSLGRDYSALYKTQIRNLDQGMVDVEIEMRFKRFYGFLRSVRRAKFENVALKSGKKTFLKHTFKYANRFHKKISPPPKTNEIGFRLKTATGTAGLEIPVWP